MQMYPAQELERAMKVKCHWIVASVSLPNWHRVPLWNPSSRTFFNESRVAVRWQTLWLLIRSIFLLFTST